MYAEQLHGVFPWLLMDIERDASDLLVNLCATCGAVTSTAGGMMFDNDDNDDDDDP